MKKLVICLLLTLFVSNHILAANAYPFPITYNQADGTTVTVRLHGTEDFHYMTTLDGMLVVNTGKGIYVARITEDNTLEATNVLAHNASERTAEEFALASAQDKDGFIKRGQEQREMLLAKPVIPAGATPKLFPHKGTPKVLVMLVDFTDKGFSVGEPLKNFNQSLNKEGHGKGTFQNFKNEQGISYHENRIYGSVSEYFDCMSYGQFRPQFDIVPNIIHLKNEVSYYGDSENMNAFVKDACTIAKNDYNVDFSQYDSNNDGYCDLVYFTFAGQGENSGGAKSTIWSKSGTVSSFTMDGKKVCRYGVSCELAISDEYIDGIGVFCHEFSHTMGLPDFYNTTNASSEAPNQGMEYWSLMDWGMYLRDGTGSYPTPYTAWERCYMDWIDIPTITTNGHYTVYPYYEDNHNAYIIENPENDNEYLVLENIRKAEWGGGIFGQGLQVTHVNFENGYYALSTNRVNTVDKHPRMTIIPADGELYSTNNDVGFTVLSDKAEKDLFSQITGYTELSRENNLPNFDWFTNANNKTVSSTSPTYPNHTKIYNIQENEDGSIEFDVILDTTTGINKITSTTNKQNKTYNLNGQEVNKDFRGVIIKGGRKYLNYSR